MTLDPRPAPAWASALPAAVAAVQGPPTGDRQAKRAELWRLLRAGLFAAARSQAGRIAPVSQEDLEDVASAKALELLAQAEGNQWEAGHREPREVAGFLWRVARNGLIDLARRRGRESPPPTDAEAWDHALVDRSEREAGPVELTAAGEFVADLATCVERLAPRARTAWYRRAILERPSRETASVLRVTAAHVDVIVQRARQSLAECMTARGHASTDVHPQAFVMLWSRWAPGAPGDENLADGTDE